MNTLMRSELESALWLIWVVWLLIVAGFLAESWLGWRGAGAASCLTSALVVWATRRSPVRRPVRRPDGGSALRIALGLFTGATFFPVLLVATWTVGCAIGMPREWLGHPVAVRPLPTTTWIATIVAAPLIEEPLYRERLLLVLRDRWGAILAIVGSSIVFAVPHLLPWTVLGAFLSGLLLGWVMHVTGSLTLCMSIHAGMNLRALVSGLPTDESQLALLPDLVFFAAGLIALMAWSKSRKSTVRSGLTSPAVMKAQLN